MNTDNLVYTNVGDNKEIEFKLDSDGKVKGEEKASYAGLTFTAEEAGSTIKLTKSGTPDAVSLQYSTDGTTWNDYTIDDVITLANVGDKVMFFATSVNQTFSRSTSAYYQFVMTGKIAASGNIMSLIDKTMQRTDVPEYCYFNMFSRCTSLTTVPELSATTLAYRCYRDMFRGCTSLTQAPELPSTILAERCYETMFNGCTSLTTAPELPATILAEGCYEYMFYGCASLTTAPELHATTLANYCYNDMFRYCPSLTTAPELHATTLVAGCYMYMFYGCTNLNSVTMLAEDVSASNCLITWLTNVSSTGTFTKKSGTTLPTGVSGIPTGWTVVNV